MPSINSLFGTVRFFFGTELSFLTREFLHRLPDPRFHLEWGDRAILDRAQEATATLRRDGIVLLPGYFSGDFMKRLCDAFEALMSNKQPAEEDPDAFHDDNYLDADPVFLEAALDDLVVNVVGEYYRRQFFLGHVNAFRLLPTEPKRYGSFQWHHDARGRQINVMTLLTPVLPDGQRMKYLRGTHRGYYGYDRMSGKGSRFEDDLKARPIAQDQVLEVVGPAGTVAIFDANGLHSGNRNQSQRRDTLTFVYTTGRKYRRLRFRRQNIEALPDIKRPIVTLNPLHELV